MRDPKRMPTILGLLGQVWLIYPDWRLGQVVFNATGVYDCFHVEDDELEAGLRRLLAEAEAHRA